MNIPHKVNVEKLGKKVTELSDALAHLDSPDDWKRLIILIHRPGWTTEPEFILTSAIVETMLNQAIELSRLKTKLLEGCEVISAKEAVLVNQSSN